MKSYMKNTTKNNYDEPLGLYYVFKLDKNCSVELLRNYEENDLYQGQLQLNFYCNCY